MIGIRQSTDPCPVPVTTACHRGPDVAEVFAGTVAGVLGDRTILRATRGVRLLRAGRPPLFFLPPSALALKHARPSDTVRIDEIGLAVFLHLASGGQVSRDAAWYYPGPDPELAIIAGMVCLDPSRLSSLTLDGVPMSAGGIPGSWMTAGAACELRHAGNR